MLIEGTMSVPMSMHSISCVESGTGKAMMI